MFLGNDMPTAQQHQLIADARTRHQIELQVLDASAIAEQLADHDTYWIAVRYLSLPEQYAPPRPQGEGADEPEWYLALREDWRGRDTPPRSLADLIAIRDGLRRATFVPAAREDLGFWLDLIRPMTAHHPDEDVRERARYELVVASIRGLGDMRAVDALADAFLAAAAVSSDPARLEDASVALSYAGTAASIGHSDLNLAVLGDRRAALRRRVKELLADNPPPVRRARLLQVAGHLALTPDTARLTPASGAPPAAQVAMLDGPREPVLPEIAEGLCEIADLDDAVAAWTELSTLIPDTPLFPVDEFTEIVQYLTPALIDADGWEGLVTALDAATGRVAGGARAGELCRDRAVALRRNERPLDALHEIHRAKVEWWTGDTLRGALLAMSFIAHLYRDLKLPLAAKQYALAVAGAAHAVGDNDVADLVPTGMLLASELSYQSGDWLAALEELEIGVISMHALGQEETPAVMEMAMRAAFTATMCLRAARELCPELIEQVEAVLDRVGLLDAAAEVLEGIEPMTQAEWQQCCDRDLLGRPFADIGERYHTRFAALGTRWTLSCANEYAHVRATQRLAAALQVMLVELAAIDLCLMPTEIEVTVTASPKPSTDIAARVEALPSNEGRRWQIDLVEYVLADEPNAVDSVEDELLATITRFLLDVSLLPTNDYYSAIESAFERGLGHKLLAGRPYDELADIVPPDRFNASERLRYEPPLATNPPSSVEHPDLGWQAGPGPGFSPGKAVEMAANRYEKITSLLSKTLPALASIPQFQSVVERLRGAGWLDWHILVAVFNVAVNYRLREAGLNTAETIGTPEGQRAAAELSQTAEASDMDPVPAELFDEQALRAARMMGIAPLLLHWGLEPRQRTPDYPAIEQILTLRYGYWSIDAEHKDPFSVKSTV